MSEVTFKESLLVPVSYFKNKRRPTSKKRKYKTGEFPPVTPQSLLSDEGIPADLRMKYFDSMVKFDKTRPPPPINVMTISEKKEEQEQEIDNQREEDIKIILNDLPDSKKPLGSSIANFMKDAKDISWNSRYEIVLDGQVIPDSDIRKIIQFLLGEVIYTSGKLDTPIGAEKIKEKLEILEIPPSWLKHVPRSSKRKQTGSGLKFHRWIVY